MITIFAATRDTAASLRRRFHHRHAVRLRRRRPAADRLTNSAICQTQGTPMMNGRFLLNRSDGKLWASPPASPTVGVDPLDHPPRPCRRDPDHRPGVILLCYRLARRRPLGGRTSHRWPRSPPTLRPPISDTPVHDSAAGEARPNVRLALTSLALAATNPPDPAAPAGRCRSRSTPGTARGHSHAPDRHVTHPAARLAGPYGRSHVDHVVPCRAGPLRVCRRCLERRWSKPAEGSVSVPPQVGRRLPTADRVVSRRSPLRDAPGTSRIERALARRGGRHHHLARLARRRLEAGP